VTRAAAAEGDDVFTRGNPSVRVFNDKDGVPQSSILAMAFEPHGKMWIATQGGPAYYDGRSWNAVLFPNATSNFVRALALGSDGSLWCGTDGGGLWRLKNEVWTTFDASNGLPGSDVWAVVEQRGVVWAATARGLARYDGERWVSFTTKNSPLPNDAIHVLLAGTLPGGEPTLWIGTEHGLAHVEGDRWTVITSATSGLSDDYVRSLLETKNERGEPVLWVGTDDGGLARLERGAWATYRKSTSPLPNDSVRALAETTSAKGTHTLWIGTYGGGLTRIENGAWTTFDAKNSALPNNYIFSIADSGGAEGVHSLWVGTDGGGLARFRLDGWVGYNTKNSSLPDSGVYAFLETQTEGKRTFWIATDDGLARYADGAWSKLDTKSSALPNDYVMAIVEPLAERGKDVLWLGTDNGLARYDRGKIRVFNSKNSGLPNDHVLSLYETGPLDHRALWIGTGRGLARLDGGAWSTFDDQNSGLVENRVYSMLETTTAAGKKTMWVGTLGGLSKLEDGAWESFTVKNAPLRNNQILGLTEIEDAHGVRVLWIGTGDGGVARRELDTGAWRPTLNDHSHPALPDNVVYQVREDAQHRVYLFTNKGVARLTPRTPTADDPSEFSIYTFTIEDGLTSNECNTGGSFVDGRGRVWAGTISGAAVFDPSEEVFDRVPKPLVIERARLPERAQHLLPDEVLAHDQNTLSFDYALLSFFRERETRFRTQLVGFDREPSEWTYDAKSRFTNLPPGAYAFQVWGRDYAGNVSGPVAVRFRVRPAPWRTWWAYLAYALLAFGVGYTGYRMRVGALDRRNKALEARVGERTAELDRKNEELADNLNKLEAAQAEAMRKNDELDRKIAELDHKNRELLESHRRADLIFSALADVLPGTLLDGKYRLDEKIGTGGFGAVFRGTHLSLGRAVAVKVFRPSSGNDSAEALERFRREGMTACRVNHPNAVYVLDSGITVEGIAYLVMELLVGHSLADELRRKRALSLRRCAEILTPVCNVLGVAHAAGLIHRDIKPDNIFLHRSKDGEVVKVVDFGIAKLMGLESDQLLHLTGTGGLIGTPSYMAPERFTRGDYDERSDIYSVGVTLFEMVCGRLPFPTEHKAPFDVVLRQLTEPPDDLRAINPLVPPDAAAIVLRCLAKDMLARPTPAELARAFADAIDALPDAIKDAVSLHRAARDSVDPAAATISRDDAEAGLDTGT
jgi:serine/threonine protein kinase/ligand-binding sensor domain-containing protein